jgi:glycosyltransferase involved in cell wall biosynthesis
MMFEKSMVTVIILSYNNQQYILQAIHSVIAQNYPYIQIIVSDDCSKNFDEQQIMKYIDKYKRSNIKSVIICKNERNLGTVKNINLAFKRSIGKYIKLLAADDELYDSNVLNEFVQHLEKSDLMIATSTFAVYDENLSKMKYLLPESTNKKFIENLSPDRLYGKLAVSNIIGGVGVFIRKDLIIKYCLFDEKYALTEDLPTWLVLSRNGVKIGYLDKITVKYRLNGVSNGAISPHSQVLRNDLVKIIDNEIFPNFYMLTSYERREVKFIRMNMNLEKFTIKKILSTLFFSDIILYRRWKKLNLYVRRIIDGKLSSF